MSRRVLVLRPEPGASETFERALQLGLAAVAIPLFRVEPMEWQPPDPAGFDALLLTSANAVRCAGKGLQPLRGFKAYAVGEATAAAARDAGLDIASTGDAGVARLLGSIEPDLRMLHLCGEERTDAPDARQRITAVAVYRTVPTDADLSGVAGAVALIHSPRAGRRFAELVADRSSIAVAAISAAAADEAGEGWERVEAAARPTEDALLALAARLCNISPLE